MAYGKLPIDVAIHTIFIQVDFWLWFYLAFTVSSMMLPSASDRRAWIPLTLGLIILLVMALFAGAGPWMLSHLAPTFNDALQALAIMFGISAFLHFALILPVFGLRKLLSRITGLDVV